MKRMLVVAVVTLAVALGLVGFANRERDSKPAGDVVAPVPVHRTSAELTAEGLEPPKVRVPKDHEVHLLVSAGTAAWASGPMSSSA